MVMSLNERKIKILQAIINDYIQTAEPVGSRTIAKKYNLGISSATIRNEMSDLEEMGYIIQPHASAGRIPSDLGYRLYVDQLMQHKEPIENSQIYTHLASIINRNISQIDYLMEETARALSMLTNYTTIISEPLIRQTKLKQIRLIPFDSQSLMLIIATEENFIKNYILKMRQAPDDEKVFRISTRLNNILKGHSLEDIDEEIVNLLKSQFQDYIEIIDPVINAIETTIKASEDVQVHLSGAKNILAFPEFSDTNKAKMLFQTLEEKDVLITLLGERTNDDMQILIGNENTIEQMKDCSVITTSYRMGEHTRGSIGILGPTRMDYSQVVSTLNSMVTNIERILKMLAEGKNDS